MGVFILIGAIVALGTTAIVAGRVAGRRERERGER